MSLGPIFSLSLIFLLSSRFQKSALLTSSVTWPMIWKAGASSGSGLLSRSMLSGWVNHSRKASRSSLCAAYTVCSSGAGLVHHVALEGHFVLLLLWNAALGGMAGSRTALGLYCCMVSVLLAELFLREDPVMFRFQFEGRCWPFKCQL